MLSSPECTEYTFKAATWESWHDLRLDVTDMTHALCCCSDLPSLLDEWATSLFRELDYKREAQNGMRFKKLFGDLEVGQLLSPASCLMSVWEAHITRVFGSSSRQSRAHCG